MRVRSRVPNPFESTKTGKVIGESTADVLFGPAKAGVRRSPFDNAFDRVRSNFAGEETEIERINDEQVYAQQGDDVFKYDPTKSSRPPRPRTLRAGWVRPKGSETGTVVIQFREGAVYEYYDVPYQVWRNFRRVQSPGKAMNRRNGLIGGGYRYLRVSG